MAENLESVETIFRLVVGYAILAIEAVGAVVILYFAAKAVVRVFRSRAESRELLTEGITTGLSFLLAGEVLKTIVAPDWKDIGMTCAILLMRAAITFLVKWESAGEEKEAQEAEKGK